MSNILPSNNNHPVEINNLCENQASHLDPASLIDVSFNTKDASTPATEMNHELAEFERKLRSITDKLSVNREGFVQLPQDIAQQLATRTRDHDASLSKFWSEGSRIFGRIIDFLRAYYAQLSAAENRFTFLAKELEDSGRCVLKEEIFYPQPILGCQYRCNPMVAVKFRQRKWLW
jgi:hypothetical protein